MESSLMRACIGELVDGDPISNGLAHFDRPTEAFFFLRGDAVFGVPKAGFILEGQPKTSARSLEIDDSEDA